jgi:CBS domain-containing protein
MRVRDLMTRDVVSLRIDSSIDAAAWSLSTARVSGAPVRDASGRVVGVITRSDLIDPLRSGRDASTVGDAMTPSVWAVDPDDDAIDAMRLMLDKGIHRVVVLAGPGKLVGIFSAMDVLRAIVRRERFAEEMLAGEP